MKYERMMEICAEIDRLRNTLHYIERARTVPVSHVVLHHSGMTSDFGDFKDINSLVTSVILNVLAEYREKLLTQITSLEQLTE